MIKFSVIYIEGDSYRKKKKTIFLRVTATTYPFLTYEFQQLSIFGYNNSKILKLH